MNARDQGFILLVLLIWMSWFSLMIQGWVTLFLKYYELSQTVQQHIIQLQHLEAVMQALTLDEKRWPDEQGHYFKGQIRTFHQDYTYTVEDLGSFACLHLLHHQKNTSSHHWMLRVTDLQAGLTLQIRLAKPDEVYHPCASSQKVRLISGGWLSWQVL